MNFLLKIVGEKKSGSHRKCDGACGLRYVFKWNDKLQAYTYEPKTQSEVDDLYKNKSTVLRYAPVDKLIAPVVIESVEITDEQRAALTTPSSLTLVPAREPLDPDLVEQCLARGVIVTEDDTDETARRLISAYDKGATDQLSRLAGANAKPRKNKPEGAAAKTG